MKVNSRSLRSGKMSWEVFHQATDWILTPYSQRSRAPKFQCLLPGDGQTPEWYEGSELTSPGGSWTPNIGQAPDWHDGRESFSWQILEGGVLPKYCLSPAKCSRFLTLAQRAGCPPPREIEALLLQQGGAYPSSDPFRHSECAAPQSTNSIPNFSTASDSRPILFPRF